MTYFLVPPELPVRPPVTVSLSLNVALMVAPQSSFRLLEAIVDYRHRRKEDAAAGDAQNIESMKRCFHADIECAAVSTAFLLRPFLSASSKREEDYWNKKDSPQIMPIEAT